MKITSHNGGLPYGFTEWMRFYERFNWSEIKPNDLLRWEEFTTTGYHKFEYTQDYLKAKCFDELNTSTLDESDLIQIIQSLHMNGIGNDFHVKDKIEKLLKMYHDKQFVERMRVEFKK